MTEFWFSNDFHVFLIFLMKNFKKFTQKLIENVVLVIFVSFLVNAEQ